jgi:methylaspartate mutase sigma subunit
MTVELAAAGRPDRTLEVVVTGLSSDAHTWNLVYLQLLLEELGCRVTNLGACTPDATIVRECLSRRPALLVISSLNGHGGHDGARLVRAMRARPELLATPAVIGGKLDVTGGDTGRTAARLLAAGFDAVFEDTGGLTRFRSFVRTLGTRDGTPLEGATNAFATTSSSGEVVLPRAEYAVVDLTTPTSPR